MRTLLVAFLVVTLVACGATPVPDAPRPAPRGSPALPMEAFALDVRGASAVSLYVDHAAWGTNGEVSWIDARGRGVLPGPTAFLAGGTSGSLSELDAQGDHGFALAWRNEAGGGGTARLFELSLDGPRELPSPPEVALQRESTKLLLWAPGVLVLAAEARSTDEAPRLCVFEANTWRCTDVTEGRGLALVLHGRDPLDASRVVFDLAPRSDAPPVAWTFEIATGALAPRAGDATPLRPLGQDGWVAREGRPALRVERLSTVWALDCVDLGPRLVPTCAGQGATTDLVFSEAVAGEVGHARVETPLGPARVFTVPHALGPARVYGDALVALDRLGGVIVRLP